MIQNVTGFSNIIIAVTLEALFQKGRESLDVRDTKSLRKAFVDEITKSLAIEFISNLNDMITKGLITSKELKNLKAILPPELSDIIEMIEKGQYSKPPQEESGSVFGPSPLKGLDPSLLSGKTLPKSFSSEDEKETQGVVLKDKTEGMKNLPSTSMFKDEDFIQ